MMKLLAIAIALSCYVSGAFAASTNYQDWWWNPAASGMGITLGNKKTLCSSLGTTTTTVAAPLTY